jgi:hypothetical protein
MLWRQLQVRVVDAGDLPVPMPRAVFAPVEVPGLLHGVDAIHDDGAEAETAAFHLDAHLYLSLGRLGLEGQEGGLEGEKEEAFQYLCRRARGGLAIQAIRVGVVGGEGGLDFIPVALFDGEEEFFLGAADLLFRGLAEEPPAEPEEGDEGGQVKKPAGWAVHGDVISKTEGGSKDKETGGVESGLGKSRSLWGIWIVDLTGGLGGAHSGALFIYGTRSRHPPLTF